MCKEKYKGGRRCRSHTQEAISRAEAGMDKDLRRLNMLNAFKIFVEKYERENAPTTFAEARRAFLEEQRTLVDGALDADVPKTRWKLENEALPGCRANLKRRSDSVTAHKEALAEFNLILEAREDAREERRNRNRVPVTLKEIQAEEKRQTREAQREYNARVKAMSKEESDAEALAWVKESKEDVARARGEATGYDPDAIIFDANERLTITRYVTSQESKYRDENAGKIAPLYRKRNRLEKAGDSAGAATVTAEIREAEHDYGSVEARKRREAQWEAEATEALTAARHADARRIAEGKTEGFVTLSEATSVSPSYLSSALMRNIGAERVPVTVNFVTEGVNGRFEPIGNCELTRGNTAVVKDAVEAYVAETYLPTSPRYTKKSQAFKGAVTRIEDDGSVTVEVPRKAADNPFHMDIMSRYLMDDLERHM